MGQHPPLPGLCPVGEIVDAPGRRGVPNASCLPSARSTSIGETTGAGAAARARADPRPGGSATRRRHGRGANSADPSGAGIRSRCRRQVVQRARLATRRGGRHGPRPSRPVTSSRRSSIRRTALDAAGRERAIGRPAQREAGGHQPPAPSRRPVPGAVGRHRRTGRPAGASVSLPSRRRRPAAARSNSQMAPSRPSTPTWRARVGQADAQGRVVRAGSARGGPLRRPRRGRPPRRPGPTGAPSSRWVFSQATAAVGSRSSSARLHQAQAVVLGGGRSFDAVSVARP